MKYAHLMKVTHADVAKAIIIHPIIIGIVVKSKVNFLPIIFII